MLNILNAGLQLASGFLASREKDADRKYAEKQAAQQYANQKEFAKNSISWRVEDARRNDINPLAALGVPSSSYSPIAIGSGGGSPVADSLSRIGSDISRAQQAGSTKSRQQNNLINGLAVERASLENELLRTKIASQRRLVTAPGTPPGLPDRNFQVPGAGDGPMVKPTALTAVRGAPSQPQSEGGAITDVGYARTSTGWAPVPSEDVKNRIEDQIVPELMWAVRNNVMPSFGYNMAPPPFKAPAGKKWTYSVPRQEYQLVPK